MSIKILLIFSTLFCHCTLKNGIAAILTNIKLEKETKILDWWQTAIFYQIYPRSFKDSNGDGVGDLKGIIEKLSYLKETGIEAAWLSPIFKSPMVDFGYDISSFTSIHDEYGTMHDFENLIKAAKQIGIKMILDFVPNHSSNKCDWFIKSENEEAGFEDFYIWSDGIINKDGKRRPPNNWISVFRGPAWTWSHRRHQFYFHQFTSAQPDLNYRNPKVFEVMDNVIKFWLNKGVSGFRVDAVPHLFEVEDLRDEPETGREEDTSSYDYLHHYYTKDLPEVYNLVRHWRDILDEYKVKYGGETRVMLTEAYTNLTSTIDYYEDIKGRKISHLPFNFLLITDLNEKSDARDFVFTIQKWLTYMPIDGTPNWVLGNHDQPRVGTRYGKQRIDAMNLLLLTLPGVAVTYNGEEIGMLDHRDIPWEQTKDPAALNTNKKIFKKFSRDPCRTPFQWNDGKNAGFSSAETTWLPIQHDYKHINLAQQIKENKSHYKFYTKLAKLRDHPSLKNGKFRPVVLNRRVFAYIRELKGHPPFIIVINIGNKEENVNLNIFGDLPEKLFVVAAGSTSNYIEGVIVETSHIPLTPYDCVIFKGDYIDFAQRREIIKTIIKAGNVLLIGMLMYKLWNNKWTKLTLYPKDL